MRRLWTAVGLIALLLIAASMMGAQERRGIFGERDVVNHVICYSRSQNLDAPLSCVYVPADGTQVRVPKDTGGRI